MRYSLKNSNVKLIISFTFFVLVGSIKLIAQPLSANGGLSQTICNGSSATIGGSPTAMDGAGGYSYSWAPATGLSSTTVSNPLASPSSTQTYTITVTDAVFTVATSTVTVTVNPLPTVDPLFSPSICNGNIFSGSTFASTPAGASFNWTNTNPSIGLPPTGSGDVPSFTATNAGTTPVVATISVTATNLGCTGPPMNYTITVRPTPVGTSTPSSQSRCSGINCNFPLSSTVVGTAFNWTTTGSGVSGNGPGSGTVIAQSVTATTSSPGTATYYVTPVAAGCAGAQFNATLTVNPIPVATVTSSPLARCSGDTASFSVSSNVAGTTFSWTATPSNVSGVSPLSGTGTFVFDTLTATTSSPGTAVYLFTPVAAGCTGTAVFPYVTVNPYPNPNFNYSSPGCQYSANALPSFVPGASAGVFSAVPAGIVINSSTGEIDLTASTPNFYSITNSIVAAGGCPTINANQGFNITPFPDVTASPAVHPTICSGNLASVTFTGSVGGTTFPWTSSEMNTSGSALSGTGNISEVLSAVSSGTTTYTITPTRGACPGTPLIYSVGVTPMPDATFSYASPACQNSANLFPTFPPGASAGNFTVAPAGIFINASTGEIDMASSSVGGYSITNTIAASGGCPSVNSNTGFSLQETPNITASPSIYPTICSGDMVSIAFSSSSVGTTFYWTSSEVNTTGSAGSGFGNIIETVTTTGGISGTTTYTITPSAAGCIGNPFTSVINVNPAADATFSLPFFGCMQTPNIFPTFAGSAGPGTFSSSPIGLTFADPMTGEIDLTLSTPGSYTITNTIPAGGGCPASVFNVPGFVINPFLDPNITDITYACYGPAFNLVSATTGGTWSGVGITDALLGTFDPTTSGLGSFTVTYTSPGPCFYSDNSTFTVVTGDIEGDVTYSGGPLSAGITSTAVLFYHAGTFISFDTVQVTPVDNFGHYYFDDVYPGNYIVEIYADTTVYPLAVPTYYPSEFLWDTAAVITHGCGTNSIADVFVIEGIVTSGPGMISGFVTEGDGFVRTPGDPIPGLDVKLGKNPGGNMVTNTQTTSPLGAYAFSNLPINTPGEFYTVYVDIPGLQRDSVWNITVTATNTTFTNINYEADSNSVFPIYPFVTSMISAESENSLNVFPNPAQTSATVEYTLNSEGMVSLEVYNVLGKKIRKLVSASQPAGQHQVTLKDLNSGVYFIKLNINNQTNTIRLVVTE